MMTSHKGFSLIELIIVLIIIGILSSIAAPMYSSMTWKARYAEVFAVVGTILAAEQTYYAEYEAYPRPAQAECFAGKGVATGDTQIQKILGISIDSSSYFNYLIYPSDEYPTYYRILFRQISDPQPEWAWYYTYAPPSEKGWYKYPVDGGDAQKYFSQPK